MKARIIIIFLRIDGQLHYKPYPLNSAAMDQCYSHPNFHWTKY